MISTRHKTNTNFKCIKYYTVMYLHFTVKIKTSLQNTDSIQHGDLKLFQKFTVIKNDLEQIKFPILEYTIYKHFYGIHSQTLCKCFLIVQWFMYPKLTITDQGHQHYRKHPEYGYKNVVYQKFQLSLVNSEAWWS
jgi:hypothetical protein